MRIGFRSLLLSILTLSFGISLWPSRALAQVEPPNRKEIFEEDVKDEIKKEDKLRKDIVTPDKSDSQDVDFKAPSVEYLKDPSRISGKGGVLISTPDLQVQADEAVMDLNTKDADLHGGILLTGPDGVLSSEEGKLNVDNETGTFSKADFTLEQGAYDVYSDEVHKLSETKYSLYGSKLTTCHCADGSCPWYIHSSKTNVTQEGYAHAYNTWVDFHGVPIFYSPYLGFPVKQERTSGLLVPQIGYGSKDGVLYKQPIFAVINDSVDMTFTPFTESKTRHGLGIDYRQSFSKSSGLATRWIYSDERPRDGDLRGTNVSGMYDPTFDEDRLGGFVSQSWQSDADVAIPSTLITDIHYVSDDLFSREIEDDDILDRTDKYATSQIALRSVIGEFANFELGGEFSQAVQNDNDDYVLQRLPQASLSMLKSFRPFGFNSYGLKLVARADLEGTTFRRNEGFDGQRYRIVPSLKIPFHVKNYFSSDLTFAYTQNEYRLDSVKSTTPGGADLEDSNSLGVGSINYQVSSGVERAYDLPEGNWLSYISSLGADNQENRLRRVKHTIEPTVKYTYVPHVDQNDVPFFDSLDRMRERNLVTYGVVSRLMGRFNPRDAGASDIAELSPRVEDLPSLTGIPSISDFGEADQELSVGDVKVRNGEIRELANISLRQSYDFSVDGTDPDPTVDPLSDLALDIGLFPSNSFGIRFEADLNTQDQTWSQWGISAKLRDDRGDSFVARYSFTEDVISQIEGNLEIKITDRVRLGYYGRFDERESNFLENRGALRFVSDCNCWHLDLGYSEMLNPDKKQMILQFTFTGLGDVTQGLRYNDRNQ